MPSEKSLAALAANRNTKGAPPGKRKPRFAPLLHKVLQMQLKEQDTLFTLIETEYPGILEAWGEDKTVYAAMALKLTAMAFDPRVKHSDQLNAIKLIFEKLEGKIPIITMNPDSGKSPYDRMSNADLLARINELKKEPGDNAIIVEDSSTEDQPTSGESRNQASYQSPEEE